MVESAREALLRVDVMRAERLLREGETAAAVEIMSRVLQETGDRELQAVLQSRLDRLERATSGRGWELARFDRRSTREEETMSAILSEGKTKIIRRGERPGEVVLETKDELTGGDAAKRETISGIAVWKTTQARNVFRLLQSEGIDTAYLRPGGERAMVCSECTHAAARAGDAALRLGVDPQPRALDREHAREAPPLRRAAARDLPQERGGDAAAPTEPVQMEEGKARDLYLRDGKWASGVYTDPLMRIAEDGRWLLYPAKGRLDTTPPLTDTTPLLDASELTPPRGPLDGAGLRGARARLVARSRPPTDRWRWSTSRWRSGGAPATASWWWPTSSTTTRGASGPAPTRRGSSTSRSSARVTRWPRWRRTTSWWRR